MSEKDLRIINMEDVEATEVKWLWYPYIPYGKITIIQGDPGEGKTTLVLNLAAKLTRGEKLPESVKAAEPINVLYQSAEDGLADTIKPRLIAANADVSRVLVIDETDIELSMTDHHLEAAIQQTGAKLVILDPLQAYLGAKVDMHRANEVRPVFKHLAAVAEKYECAIVLSDCPPEQDSGYESRIPYAWFGGYYGGSKKHSDCRANQEQSDGQGYGSQQEQSCAGG